MELPDTTVHACGCCDIPFNGRMYTRAVFIDKKAEACLYGNTIGMVLVSICYDCGVLPKETLQERLANKWEKP